MPQSDLMSYAAYSQGLELGGTAGVTTVNVGQTMDPKVTRQVELGIKRDISKRLLVTAAAFHIWKPYEFVDPNNVFVHQARHRGAVRGRSHGPGPGWRRRGHAHALVIALGTGFFFALFPACKTSRFDPIEALRYE